MSTDVLLLIIRLPDYQMVMIRSMSADGREALPSARLLSSNLLSSPHNPTTLTVNVMQVQLETGQQSLFAISVDFVANNDLYGHNNFFSGASS